MNKSTINQLVNQYLNSNSISTSDNTALNSNISNIYTNTNTYPNATSWPHNGYVTTSNGNYYTYTDGNVVKVLNMMPLILKVKTVSVDGNKIDVGFEKFSHKSTDKFLPDQGTIYFGQDIYGVYDKSDYLYWEDSVKIQVENIEEALKVIKKGILFTTVNNWDERITNQEVFLFLQNIKAYKRHAHIVLEALLNEDQQTSKENLNRKLEIHSELDNKLI